MGCNIQCHVPRANFTESDINVYSGCHNTEIHVIAINSDIHMPSRVILRSCIYHKSSWQEALNRKKLQAVFYMYNNNSYVFDHLDMILYI